MTGFSFAADGSFSRRSHRHAREATNAAYYTVADISATGSVGRSVFPAEPALPLQVETVYDALNTWHIPGNLKRLLARVERIYDAAQVDRAALRDHRNAG